MFFKVKKALISIRTSIEVRIEMSAFFTLKNIIILLIISLVNWIEFMVLPVVTTVEENAKKLLNSKG